ncbi:ABC transporter ATP-binding protein [Paucibacter sp. R3-3]|uniref:ABC transporter ATP-binding protein n=1 Tax=Roseateles agri TaxID=3098619 RepID=A0ABU5DGG4_9BURK|nr:ABC transporter ATP-binding protein [Paucibacter sp. R3-3]MDY0744886.1 ABC transporter ATP-binding protein [Paucibacter sp. R3-3]
MLEVDDLRIRLHGTELVRGLSFTLAAGETLGLIGESGSGKTLTALALMGLLPEGAELSGSIRFKGQDLTGLKDKAWGALRGRHIAMVFQEPMTALNPLHRVGDQVAEPRRLHLARRAGEARQEAVELLRYVGLGDPGRIADSYPHQLSGGQRQRVGIAMALACGPELLIADEPSTALDASQQAHVLATLAAMAAERGMALLLISHDLALVARQAQRLLVMYAGQGVEQGPAAALLGGGAAHPYTQGLLAARPRIGVGRGERLPALPGAAPELAELRGGCAFRERCRLAQEACRKSPPVFALDPAHWSRCLRVEEALREH